jgi:hypothetical protein
MSTAQIINDYIERMALGEPFASAELLKYGSRANIDQILSRLVKSGELTRVARGIFVRPEKTSYLNVKWALPEPSKIASTVARSSGEIIVPHGAEAARRLQLSTQTQTKPVFFTSGATRHIKTGNMEIVLKHVSHRKIANAGTIAGLVISALWYLGKNQISQQIIEKVQKRLSPEQFQQVQESTHSMPGWMADAFYHYKQEHRIHAQ